MLQNGAKEKACPLYRTELIWSPKTYFLFCMVRIRGIPKYRHFCCFGGKRPLKGQF